MASNRFEIRDRNGRLVRTSDGGRGYVGGGLFPTPHDDDYNAGVDRQRVRELEAEIKAIKDEPRLVATVVELRDSHMLVSLGPGNAVDINLYKGARVGDRVLLTRNTMQATDVIKDDSPTGTVITVERIGDKMVEATIMGGVRAFKAPSSFKVRKGERVIVDPSLTFVIGTLGMPPAEFSLAAQVTVRWDDVGGQEEAKNALREAIELPLSHPALFKAYGKKMSKGVLLSGPPGCGKTLIGKAAATAIGRAHGKEHGAFIYVKGPELLQSWIGKCLGKGTPVLMFDGRTLPVEDVAVGDVLMGTNSTPRTVRSLGRGRAPMYRVHPTKGAPWTCNNEHILTLVGQGDRRDVVRDIAVKDFLALSAFERKQWKLWRVGVDFPRAEQAMDPYLIGLWLGDGSVGVPAITTTDHEVIDYLAASAERLGLRCSVRDDDRRPHVKAVYLVGESNSNAPNPFLDAVRACYRDDQKFIPREYLVADREQRLAMLAGLLDTDGYLCNENCGFEIVTKFDALRDGILFLARSLGFAAYSALKESGIKSTGFTGTYHRIIISGDLDRIPTRVERRKASPRVRTTRVNVTSFELEPIGDGDYYGFTIDGDHRFLLGDFTVTHNTEEQVRAIFKAAREHKERHGYPVVVLLDECDALLGARDRGQHTTLNATVVPQFLAEMDGLDDSAAMFLLATNRPDMLDPAVVREGRVDRKVRVERPTLEDARAIFTIHMRERPIMTEAGTLTKKDGEEHWLGVKRMAEIATDRLFADSAVVRDLGTVQVLARHFASGAMIAGLVEEAATLAVVDDITAGRSRAGGISQANIDAAIARATGGLAHTDLREVARELDEQAAIRRHQLGTADVGPTP